MVRIVDVRCEDVSGTGGDVWGIDVLILWMNVGYWGIHCSVECKWKDGGCYSIQDSLS